MEALFDFFNKVSPVSFAFACEYLDVFGVDAQPTGIIGFWARIGIRCRGGKDTGVGAGNGAVGLLIIILGFQDFSFFLSLFNIMLILMLSHALSMLYLCFIYALSIHHPCPVYVLKKGREGHEGREGQVYSPSMPRLCTIHAPPMPRPFPVRPPSIPRSFPVHAVSTLYLRCIYAVSMLYLCCIYAVSMPPARCPS